MQSALRSLLISGAMCAALALGSMAARADEAADLEAAQAAAAQLDAATGGENIVSRAMKDPEAQEALETMYDAVLSALEE